VNGHNLIEEVQVRGGERGTFCSSMYIKRKGADGAGIATITKNFTAGARKGRTKSHESASEYEYAA